MGFSREPRQSEHSWKLQSAWVFLPNEEKFGISRYESLLRKIRCLIIPMVDILLIMLAQIVAYFFAKAWMDGRVFDDLIGQKLGIIDTELLWMGVASIPLWMMVFVLFGVYKREVRSLSISTFDELPQTVGALAIGAWISVSFLLLFTDDAISFKTIWIFVACAWVFLTLTLPVVRALVRMSTAFYNPFGTSALILGSGEVGHSLIGKLKRHKEYGLRIVGFLEAADWEEGVEVEGKKILSSTSDLREIIERYGVSRALIAFSRESYEKTLQIIHEFQEMKVDVSVVPRFFEAYSDRVRIEDVEGLPVVSLPRYTRHGWIMRAAKRCIDLTVTSLAIVFLSPVLLITAILIKLDSSGPVCFKQERLGKNHRHFFIYKFRSMTVGAEQTREDLVVQNEVSGPIFKMKEDPRITRVGRIIRLLSIDELPQLFNVLRGEMSLVGPRPLPVMEAKACEGTADMRHMVQPGITGLWQILGRSDIPYEEMVQLDYIYVTNWTLRWDIKIMLRTLIAIMRKRGAY